MTTYPITEEWRGDAPDVLKGHLLSGFCEKCSQSLSLGKPVRTRGRHLAKRQPARLAWAWTQGAGILEFTVP